MSATPVIALIGDIVNSRGVSERAALQRTLREEFAGYSLHEAVLSPYTITLGDEFQAVFSRSEPIFEQILRLQRAIFPVRCRFALGIGPLATPINPRQAIGMDGPAFHRARQCLNRLKGTPAVYGIEGLTLPSGLQLGRSTELTLQLVSHLHHKWKANRWQILVQLLRGSAVAEIAGALGISESAVYKNIQEGMLEVIIDVYRDVTARMDAALAGYYP